MTKKHQRYADQLKAQTLPCQDCGKTAYALWSHPTEGGRGTDYFGLCKPCEAEFIASCEANVRHAHGDTLKGG